MTSGALSLLLVLSSAPVVESTNIVASTCTGFASSSLSSVWSTSSIKYSFDPSSLNDSVLSLPMTCSSPLTTMTSNPSKGSREIPFESSSLDNGQWSIQIPFCWIIFNSEKAPLSMTNPTKDGVPWLTGSAISTFFPATKALLVPNTYTVSWTAGQQQWTWANALFSSSKNSIWYSDFGSGWLDCAAPRSRPK